jgi:AcrR family transcriptional regulator
LNPADPTPPRTGPGKKPRDARPPRADALRNRDKLLQAAKAAFAAADSTVPLEGIAREAGVGIGTLYRHFPTREALVEAVYAAELDDVTGSAHALLKKLPPAEALRAWMERYAAFIATKRGLADTLRAGWASGRIATPATRERITTAVATILARGAEDGSLRADVEPEDVTVILLGTLLVSTPESTPEATPESAPERTARLLDLVMDALRPRA